MPYDADTYVRLVRDLLDTTTFPHNAEQIVAFACDTLDADYAGISRIRPGGRLETLCANDGVVEHADYWQRELGEGPSLDSSGSMEHTLLIEDLRADGRWPDWTKRVTQQGVRGFLWTPMGARGRRVGALSLYWKEPREYADEDIEFADIFARHAAVALATAEHEANLAVALDARTLIGQAQGILMERFGVDPHQAFEVLKRYSQDRNVKLRVVAEHLVASRRLPDAH